MNGLKYPITLDLTPEQKKAMKVLAAKKGKFIKELVKELILDELEKQMEEQ